MKLGKLIDTSLPGDSRNFFLALKRDKIRDIKGTSKGQKGGHSQ